jgi:hypothetical protein
VNAGQPAGQEWKSFEEHRDPNQNKTWETYLYYGATPEQERTVERGWDYGGQDWTSYELHKDHLLRPTWQQYLYDNGTKTVTQWDYTGQTWLWRQTHSAGDTRLWQRDQYGEGAYIYREWTGGSWDERETRYNNDGVHDYQHVIDGGVKTVHEWDRAGAYDWVEKITTTVNGVTSRVETIYDDRKSVEIFDLSGNAGWTRHVEEWRGTNFQNKVEDKYYDENTLIKELAWDHSGRDWDRYEKRFHDGGVVYHKVVKDNDTYTLDRVDYQGRNWDTISIKGRIINDVEKAYWTETLYDDSLKVLEEKDLGDADWDTIITKGATYYGQPKNYYRIASFDSGSVTEAREYWDAGNARNWDHVQWTFAGNVVFSAVTTFDNGGIAEYIPLEVLQNPDGWRGVANFASTSASNAGLTMQEFLAFDQNGDGGIDLDSEMPLARAWLESRPAQDLLIL